MSHLREEYDRLLDFMQRTKKGEQVNVQEMLLSNQNLFAGLQVAIEKGSLEEKEEALQLFRQILAVFTEEGKGQFRKAGISEKEMELGSKASFLSSEQKNLIEKVECKLQKVKEDLKT